MRYVELRRHTMRVKLGQHLSQAGVDLACRIGSTIGPFHRVITSTIPRAYETAIAMGFAVDEQLAEISMMPDGLENEVAWDAGFAAFAEGVKRGGMVADYVRQQGMLILQIALALPDEGAALVVSHGGIVEAQTVGCLPHTDFTSWGAACDYCEGARLYFDGEQFVRGDVLRVT
ncbi:MAG: phosphoglycerate mutase family protein [Chloroflexota bacterium]